MIVSALGAWFRTRLPRGERGASLVEYVLLIALIALAVIAAIVFLGGELNESFNDSASQISDNV
jgi:pilus assembly protein Flp/PilA